METTVHEMAHALAFSPGLYPYFRDATGTVYPSFSSDQVIQGLPTKFLTTPRVSAVASSYFGCNDATLKGAPLENNGGSGSLGAHWERSVIYNDMMTASSMSGD